MYEHLNKKYILSADIGGSHISAALIDASSRVLLDTSLQRVSIQQNTDADTIIATWTNTLKTAIADIPKENMLGITLAIPGPFDYETGVCWMQGVNKYEALYGLNIANILREQLALSPNCPILFENDATCFGIGESLSTETKVYEKVLAITLGTGLGSTFIEDQAVVKYGENIPQNGYLYNVPFADGIAEDYLSAQWLIKRYTQLTGNEFSAVLPIAALALNEDSAAKQVFEEYGENLKEALMPWIGKFGAKCVVIGGNICKSASLFITPLQQALATSKIPLKISEFMELSAIMGAASLIDSPPKPWRKSSQALLPQTIGQLQIPEDTYNMYPFHTLGDGKIFQGYQTLAQWIMTQKSICIDGYVGNDWLYIQQILASYFQEAGIGVEWIKMADFMKNEEVITQIVNPFLGEKDAVWGKKTNLSMSDFFEVEQYKSQVFETQNADLTIVIGTGSALFGKGKIVYFDLPKNEIQYRMRAGHITNLGNTKPESPVQMYKRFYFVDWVVCNSHRQSIAARIEIVADGQWRYDTNWIFFQELQKGLKQLTQQPIRVRPWFEAGAWGGQWMKEHFEQINTQEVNYAWSFELIVPENGLVFESDQKLLEVSFDWLMEQQSEGILGKDAARFGTAFPIRFDFLDTFQGGNLSIQCHPSLRYIQEHFGETITQDETYYILDAAPNAKVFLGFQEDIQANEFKDVLENSVKNNIPVDIEKYVRAFEAKKHDLFLIPNGTVHSAGANNMVLEISATPYIFTFKMYDWLRLDLAGQPRPINIEHAFNNLDFSRKGERVEQELITKETIISQCDDGQIVRLSTHEQHFYAINRLEFIRQISLPTNQQCHIMMLVEGEAILLETDTGYSAKYHYAETIIVPAGVKHFKIINLGSTEVKVIQAFIK
ncbi:ROK family protein [Arcicella aquatica]|uniref:ROK family protein n=1 Tax=Arcicella aquatica TaxID=217141 RepID=A0ABU5QMW9_9BACT|nr:ROK family protein [Arcicella aquatica]MEA5258363.1 ROK family protein [Arcicella aquatica]